MEPAPLKRAKRIEKKIAEINKKIRRAKKKNREALTVRTRHQETRLIKSGCPVSYKWTKEN